LFFAKQTTPGYQEAEKRFTTIPKVRGHEYTKYSKEHEEKYLRVKNKEQEAERRSLVVAKILPKRSGTSALSPSGRIDAAPTNGGFLRNFQLSRCDKKAARRTGERPCPKVF
jgi:hypothetical protein